MNENIDTNKYEVKQMLLKLLFYTVYIGIVCLILGQIQAIADFNYTLHEIMYLPVNIAIFIVPIEFIAFVYYWIRWRSKIREEQVKKQHWRLKRVLAICFLLLPFCYFMYQTNDVHTSGVYSNITKYQEGNRYYIDAVGKKIRCSKDEYNMIDPEKEYLISFDSNKLFPAKGWLRDIDLCKKSKNDNDIQSVTSVTKEKHDYSVEAHLPPIDWNPLTASDKELAYYIYPPRPELSDKLTEWKKVVTGGWFDAETGKIPFHSHPCVPCEIVWNNQVYKVDGRCGPINGKEIGKDNNGGTVYELPGIDNSVGVILAFGTKDGHRATRIDYDMNDALASVFLDSSLFKDKLDNLGFPQTITKIKTNVNLGNKNSGRKIPVELETKIEETQKLVYVVTFIETWDTEDYYYSGCAKPVGRHYWRFKVVPNSYSDLDSGGDIPPQDNQTDADNSKLEQVDSNIDISRLSLTGARAVGKSSLGKIMIIPIDKEQIEQLGAPSCLGVESDYSFKGSYAVVFVDLNGTRSLISKYDGQIISNSKEPIKLEKLMFQDFEAFSFKPVPNRCRPDATYLYAVTKDKTSFKFLFTYSDGNITDNTPLSPNALIKVKDNQIIIPTWDNEKGDYDMVFTPDTNQKMMKYSNALDISQNQKSKRG
jgi:hypothetical protein